MWIKKTLGMFLHGVVKAAKKGFICLLPSLCLSLVINAQIVHFSPDSIPVEKGEVIFNVNFKPDLAKDKIRERIAEYLQDDFKPYSAECTVDDKDAAEYQIVDYLDILDGLFQSFGMYMTYTLKLKYDEGVCNILIRDIGYTEKIYFESKKGAGKKINTARWSGNDIMVYHKYRLMFIRRASQRITDASLKRINEIARDLYTSLEETIKK